MSILTKIYHRIYGVSVVYPVDAASAVSNFPNEWKDREWTEEEKAAVKAAEINSSAAVQ